MRLIVNNESNSCMVISMRSGLVVLVHNFSADEAAMDFLALHDFVRSDLAQYSLPPIISGLSRHHIHIPRQCFSRRNYFEPLYQCGARFGYVTSIQTNTESSWRSGTNGATTNCYSARMPPPKNTF